ncbi:sugar transporter [Pseudophaeobacter sp.]|uniref:sugar transporter n=1 Tax=Pseudophaeobacter sp. TaxID=1971739 RepID=UPI0040580DA5
MKRRHWGLMLSFVLVVLVPLGVTIFYLAVVAKDQYSSLAGFTVRQEEQGGASELLGGLAALTGSTASGDGDILYEFVLSQALIRSVEEHVGLRVHYTEYWSEDPVFALSPNSSIEDIESYWQRIVRVSYDQGSGLIELRVQAFNPEKAQDIARHVIAESQDMINALNERARADAMSYAQNDLEEAVERLKKAREAMTAFRTRTQIVDPTSDLQGRMGVMNNLQQQLAMGLIDFDMLSGTTATADPRLQQAKRRIEVIRKRITEERDSFSGEDGPGGAYPDLMAEYEGLVVDREFAEQSYRAALAALDIARANAARQSRYLATYIEPTQAETSEYPQRWLIGGLAGLFLLLGWAIMAMIYYAIRDRA